MIDQNNNIDDSVVVGLDSNGEEKVVLFVKLNSSIELNPNNSKAFALRSRIKFELGDKIGGCSDARNSVNTGKNDRLENWLNSKNGNWCKQLSSS